MGQLKCELCGSINIIKSDGVYVCEHCGCKYSIEEAKKLLVEVSGKVEVEGVDSFNQLFNRGETFLKLNDYDSALKEFQKINKQISRPSNWIL